MPEEATARCPKGTRRDKKTGVCVPTSKKQPTVAAPPKAKLPSPPKATKRCAKATLRRTGAGNQPTVDASQNPKVNTPSPTLPFQLVMENKLANMNIDMKTAANLRLVNKAINQLSPVKARATVDKQLAGVRMYKKLLALYKKIKDEHATVFVVNNIELQNDKWKTQLKQVNQKAFARIKRGDYVFCNDDRDAGYRTRGLYQYDGKHLREYVSEGTIDDDFKLIFEFRNPEYFSSELVNYDNISFFNGDEAKRASNFGWFQEILINDLTLEDITDVDIKLAVKFITFYDQKHYLQNQRFYSEHVFSKNKRKIVYKGIVYFLSEDSEPDSQGYCPVNINDTQLVLAYVLPEALTHNI